MILDEGTGVACGVMAMSGTRVDGGVEDAACVTMATPGQRAGVSVDAACVAMATAGPRASAAGRGKRSCFKCGGPNHFAMHCWTARKDKRRCFKCDEVGHVAVECPKGKTTSPTGNE